MNKVKWSWAIGSFALALGAAVYLSGFIALWVLKLDTGPLTWATYLHYVQAMDLPQVKPYATRITWSGYIGFGLPLALWLAMLALLLRDKPPQIHGDARFATAADLHRGGLFKPSDDGILVGKFGGKLVRLSGQQFAILAAPTRSGKGVGVVIPNLLAYRESAVTSSRKTTNSPAAGGQARVKRSSSSTPLPKTASPTAGIR